MEIKRAKYNLTRPVRYGGHEYIMQELILWVTTGADGKRQLQYSAVLQEPGKNSIMRVPLAAVEELEKQDGQV